MDQILFNCLDADDAFRRTQRLADDLRRIAAGNLPTATDLADAPIIDQWTLVPRAETSLVGVISGHPTIGHMRPGQTTGIFAFAPSLGWVRTFNRYYRLGFPAGDRIPQ